MKLKELIVEIERIPDEDYTGGRDYILDTKYLKWVMAHHLKPLPGGSDLMFHVYYDDDTCIVTIWDPTNTAFQEYGTPIGKMTLDHDFTFPIKKTYRVEAITVDEAYRGRSIAKSLYGIALTILGFNLISGSSQTSGGRRNWLSLYAVPGVEVMGWVEISEEIITASSVAIDELLGKIGGIDVGTLMHTYQHDTHVFMFEVQPNPAGDALVEKVNSFLTYVYDPAVFSTGLFAHWVH